ncbi:hypothetical protein [Candidatus Palauibacter sp.]|uniref:hypothetical protein n=1 Tax=Candidatus Palauibacter sp. TaxID=3101350 RepID=UPI003B5A1C19
MTRARALMCLLPGLLPGCGTSPTPDQDPDQPPEWTLRRGVTIGSVDDPVYGLSGVRRALADEDHVYVLLLQDGVVRVFTRAGEFVRDLGREGEGPGELMMPSEMGWYGSRLWVANWGSTRFTLFDVETGEAETILYLPDVPPTLYASGWAPEAVLSNGHLVGSMKLSATAISWGLVSHDVRIVTDTAGSVRDTLALLSVVGQSGEITAGLGRDRRSYWLHPLPEHDMIGFAPDGSGAVLVNRRSWEGSGPAEFEVTRIDLRGDTLFHRRIGYEPRPVPDGFFDDDIEESREYGNVVDRRAYESALREFLEQRRYFPPVARLVAGSDGTIWLGGPDDGGERWWLVLDGSGLTMGRVRLPARSYVMFANEIECWVLVMDALDIPYLVRYDIVR